MLSAGCRCVSLAFVVQGLVVTASMEDALRCCSTFHKLANAIGRFKIAVSNAGRTHASGHQTLFMTIQLQALGGGVPVGGCSAGWAGLRLCHPRVF